MQLPKRGSSTASDRKSKTFVRREIDMKKLIFVVLVLLTW